MGAVMSVTAPDSCFCRDSLPELGPRARDGALSMDEASACAAELCRSARVTGRSAECLRALVLLWHDHLEAAHGLVQDLPGAEAAFVHGILHRREPDYSNARYWFHRVGAHPVLEPLADAAAPLLAAHPALPFRLIRDGRWDPFAFIDAVSVACRGPGQGGQVGLLRLLQREETVALARHLVRV